MRRNLLKINIGSNPAGITETKENDCLTAVIFYFIYYHFNSISFILKYRLASSDFDERERFATCQPGRDAEDGKTHEEQGELTDS